MHGFHPIIGYAILLLLASLAPGCAALSHVGALGPAGNAVPTVRATSTKAPAVSPRPSLPDSVVQRGQASWYGPGFNGRKTASGEIFDQDGFTAAHKIFPLGSRVKVTNLNNGRTVEVQVVDRGPFVSGRIIDVSKAAAALGITSSGTAPVEVELIRPGVAVDSAAKE